MQTPWHVMTISSGKINLNRKIEQHRGKTKAKKKKKENIREESLTLEKDNIYVSDIYKKIINYYYHCTPTGIDLTAQMLARVKSLALFRTSLWSLEQVKESCQSISFRVEAYVFIQERTRLYLRGLTRSLV